MTTTEDSARLAAMEVWQAFASRDPDRIRAAFTPDAKWIAPPGNATAIASGYRAEDVTTVDGIVRFITGAYTKLFHDVQVDFLTVLANERTAIFEQRFRAKLVNGRAYDNLYCWVFEVRDGKVAEMREYMDTHGGFAQIFGDESARRLIA